MQKFLQALGPGMMYAGAAVGVSHLVQSTQAGALFGLGIVWVVLLANGLKYPFFAFGPRYARTTGKSLIQGYASISPAVLWFYLIITISTMFIVMAAVGLVTSGLMYQITGISATELPVSAMVAIALIICIILLWTGTYRFIDRVMKYIILTLTITTIITLILALNADIPKSGPFPQFSFTEHFAFLISFMGWMPAPLDLSVWHSIWTVNRMKELRKTTDKSTSFIDFETGYWGTVILAIFFVAMGALMIYGTGIQMKPQAGAFAAQLIGVYTEVLGSWTAPLIATAAFTTMLSTLLTCMDAFSRSMTHGIAVLYKHPEPDVPQKKHYRTWILLIAVGAISIPAFLSDSMLELVRFITIISFLAAPVIAVMNHLTVNSGNNPKETKPPLWLNVWSVIGIVFLLLFSFYYMWLEFW
jgi:Mn2+/Fe2+ NRAMP family transporter